MCRAVWIYSRRGELAGLQCDEPGDAPPSGPAEQGRYDAACPRVALSIEVDPPGLLGFLRVGMTWETAVHR